VPNWGLMSGDITALAGHAVIPTDNPFWGMLSGMLATPMAVFDNGNEQATSCFVFNSVLSGSSCP
jgi:hypothetical protein